MPRKRAIAYDYQAASIVKVMPVQVIQAKGIQLSELLLALKYMTWKTTMPSFISRSTLHVELRGATVYIPPIYWTLRA